MSEEKQEYTPRYDEPVPLPIVDRYGVPLAADIREDYLRALAEVDDPLSLEGAKEKARLQAEYERRLRETYPLLVFSSTPDKNVQET